MTVSVIIPNFNQGQYLNDAVQSCLDQSYEVLEIIVVDDGSTQPQEDYYKPYLKHPKVKLIKNEVNIGLPATRNKGLQQAKGEWILMLDCDDFIHKDFIKKTIGVDDVVSCWIKYVGDRTDVRKFIKKPLLKDYLEKNQHTIMTLFKRSMWLDLGGLDESLSGLEDWDFWIRASKKGYTCTVLQEVLAYYRKHGRSRNNSSRENYPTLSKYILNK